MTLLEIAYIAFDYIQCIVFILTVLALLSLMAMVIMVIIAIACRVFSLVRDGIDITDPDWEDTPAPVNGTRTPMSQMTEREILEMLKAGVEQLHVRRVKRSGHGDIEKVGGSKKGSNGDGKDEEWLLM